MIQTINYTTDLDQQWNFKSRNRDRIAEEEPRR